MSTNSNKMELNATELGKRERPAEPKHNPELMEASPKRLKTIQCKLCNTFVIREYIDENECFESLCIHCFRTAMRPISNPFDTQK